MNDTEGPSIFQIHQDALQLRQDCLDAGKPMTNSIIGKLGILRNLALDDDFRLEQACALRQELADLLQS